MAIIDNSPFSQTAGGASDPLSSPAHHTQEQAQNDEIAAIEDTLIAGWLNEAAAVAYVSATTFTVISNPRWNLSCITSNC